MICRISPAGKSIHNQYEYRKAACVHMICYNKGLFLKYPWEQAVFGDAEIPNVVHPNIMPESQYKDAKLARAWRRVKEPPRICLQFSIYMHFD